MCDDLGEEVEDGCVICVKVRSGDRGDNRYGRWKGMMTYHIPSKTFALVVIFPPKKIPLATGSDSWFG